MKKIESKGGGKFGFNEIIIIYLISIPILKPLQIDF